MRGAHQQGVPPPCHSDPRTIGPPASVASAHRSPAPAQFQLGGLASSTTPVRTHRNRCPSFMQPVHASLARGALHSTIQQVRCRSARPSDRATIKIWPEGRGRAKGNLKNHRLGGDSAPRFETLRWHCIGAGCAVSIMPENVSQRVRTGFLLAGSLWASLSWTGAPARLDVTAEILIHGSLPRPHM